MRDRELLLTFWNATSNLLIGVALVAAGWIGAREGQLLRDCPDRIQSFLPGVDRMVPEGLITLERVHVIAYRHAQAAERGAGREPGPD